MRVIAKRTLREFWTIHPDAQSPLLAWHFTAEKSSWKSFSDLKATYGSADYVGNSRVVFNVGGNKYRVVAAVSFETQLMFIKFVGTHEEYDRIDAVTVEHKPTT